MPATSSARNIPAIVAPVADRDRKDWSGQDDPGVTLARRRAPRSVLNAAFAAKAFHLANEKSLVFMEIDYPLRRGRKKTKKWPAPRQAVMRMDFRQLRYFVSIVDCGSLSKAAAKLRIAQPSLSQHVLNLEAELDVQLLNRTSRGVTATPAGSKLLHRGGSGNLNR